MTVRRESGETRGRWRLQRAAGPDEENPAVMTADQSESTEGYESPQPEASRPGTPGDAFDRVLRHAALARAEQGDDEN